MSLLASFDLSIILPSFNGSAHLPTTLQALKRLLNNLPITSEIIIVDDGSTDAQTTKALAEDHSVRILQNRENLGKGAAVRKGMLNAHGRIRIFTDVDLPYSLDDIVQIYKLLSSGEYEVAIGNRNLSESNYLREVPTSRRIGSRIFSFLVGGILWRSDLDTQCGLKGFQDFVAKDLFSSGKINRFAFDVELIYIALSRDYRIRSMPVKLRNWQSSDMNVPYEALRMIFDLIRILLGKMVGDYRQ